MRAFILAVTGLAIGVAACSSYGTSVVEVEKPSSVASVLITLPSSSLIAGQTQRASVSLRDANGASLSNRAVVWFTSAASVATVTDSGVVLGIAPGAATLSAVSEGVSGQAALTVIPRPPTPVAKVLVAISPAAILVGQTAHATVALQDSSGNPLTDRSVTYSSSNASVATVAGNGDISALAPGTAAITASSEGKTASASLSVSAPAPVPVATVSVSPPTSSLQVGATVQLSATTSDANNNVLTGRVVAWSSANTGIATVNSTGRVTAVSAGTVQITASSEGKSASATITVTAAAPVPVATVTVAPSTASVQVGSTVQLSATTRDANNNVLTGRVVTWSSANTGIASVNSTGRVSAVAAGTVQVTATSEGKTASSTITVTAAPAPAPVATVTVSPATASIQIGSTVQLSATTRDANNNVLTGRTIAWSSANGAIASVNTSGLVSAVAVGTIQVTATSEGQTGSSTITVTAIAPPPPGGSVEPPGMTLIADRAFNSTTSSYGPGEAGWWDSGNGALSIIQDATAPKSPTNVARMTFNGGMGGGYAPSTLERPVSGTTVYAAAWVKFSPNWQSHLSGVNKMFHFWIGGGNKLVITAAGYVPTGPLTARISLQGIASGGNNNDGGVSGTYESIVQFVRGQWHKVEVIAVANANGANGSVKLYVDGVLAAQCSGIQFSSGSPSWSLVSWSPTWGGTGGTVTSTMYEYLDHFYLSSK
jgi:uncharacterized protein YjdB